MSFLLLWCIVVDDTTDVRHADGLTKREEGRKKEGKSNGIGIGTGEQK